MFRDLDPVLHSQVRLAIMSVLIGIKNAEFSYLLDNIKTTKGNLSYQINKLKKEGYITVKKTFRGNYPLTTLSITQRGVDAFEAYINIIDEYFLNFKTTKK